MSTSQTSFLSKPQGDDKIPLGTLGYVLSRNRRRAFEVVISEFKKSGITQATLARRLGKAPEVISRLFARPQNWELDTFSELMFGISGAMLKYQADYPLSGPAKTSAPAGLRRRSFEPHVIEGGVGSSSGPP